jgi:Domain of unknown function (DUF1707)
MLGVMEPGELRAGDADRERVAERLRTALDEGRLNLHEYDERLRDAYASKTYAELDKLLADLPGVAPASRSQLVPAASDAVAPAAGRSQPGPDGRYPDATRRWLVEMWDDWAGAVAVCVAIWAVICLISQDLIYFWPGWVAGPWGAVLVVETVRGLARGEPQRWAAKQARKEAEREVRRQAKGGEPEPE